MDPVLAPLAHEATATETTSPAGAETLRVLHLHVTSPTGSPLALQVPWDRTARDVAHALLAGTDLETPDRTVRAFSQANDDVLDLPLRLSIRHADNPDGAVAVILQAEAPLSSYEAVLSCVDVSDPRPHQAYPAPLDDATGERLAPFLAGDGADWFCDGSAALECCTLTREAPQQRSWVYF